MGKGEQRMGRFHVDAHKPVAMFGEGSQSHGVDMGHLAPHLERDVAYSSVMIGSQVIMAELELFVDASVVT